MKDVDIKEMKNKRSSDSGSEMVFIFNSVYE